MAVDIQDQDLGQEQETLDISVPEFLPGTLASIDYDPEPYAELSEEAKSALQDICTKLSTADSSARRWEVEQRWKARLFQRGYQYLLRRHGGGWQLPQDGNYSAKAQAARSSQYETNIYASYGEIVTSALTRDIPQVQFQPFDPNYGPDITAADAAEKFKDVFSRNNDLRALHTQIANYMWTDERVLLYTRYVVDGQRFGFEEPEEDNPVVPEDETTGAPKQNNGQEGQDLAVAENQGIDGIEGTTDISEDAIDIDADNAKYKEQQDAAPKKAQRKPRGRELTTPYGVLEHCVPILANGGIEDMVFVKFSEEFDISISKARYPDIADQISPGGGSVGDNEIERIARINSRLGLASSYVTSGSYDRAVTETHFFLRPAAFCTVEMDVVKAELLQAFEKGCHVVYAGTEYAWARNECMDDKLHLVHARPGNGQNRLALGESLISVNERLNKWLNLLNDYFVRCIPNTWVDNEMINVEALKNQPRIPGGFHPFQNQPGRDPSTQMIVTEQMPTAQPAMPAFIETFFNEFPQLLSGAIPSLFGAEDNAESGKAIGIQRDQALARLTTPWQALQQASAVYYRQAVQIAAQCRQGKVSEMVPGTGRVNIELEDLKGKVLCYPSADAELPETRSQKSDKYRELITEAATNPILSQLFMSPKNRKQIRDAIGLKELDIPGADAYEKQLGEFELLLKTGPVPNPQVVEVKKNLLQGAVESKNNPEMAAKLQQMLPAIQQKVESLPQEVSTVPIDVECDDHVNEAACCLTWINSPEGRKFKAGNPEQKAAFSNVRTHYLEHKAQADALAAKAAASQQQTKPLSISANVKDLPPGEAAQIMTKNGIQSNPQDFIADDVAQTVIHHPEVAGK